MKLFSTYLFTLFTLNLFGQEWEITTTVINDTTYYVYPIYQGKDNCCATSNVIWASKSKKRKLPDGKWVMYFKEDSSKVAAYFELKNRKRNGHVVEYNFNGTKHYEGYYIFGEDTSYIYYYDNGNKESQGHKKGIILKNYKNKAFTSYIDAGENKEWYVNRQLKRMTIYSDNFDNLPKNNNIKDILSFLFNRKKYVIEYYQNGNKKFEEFYKNGMFDSTQTFWNSNGTIKKQFEYKNGEFIQHNPYSFYYPNGKVSEKGNIVNGKKIGKWTSYYETGEIKSIGQYDTLTYWIHDDYVSSKYFISLKVGYWYYFYPNKQVMAEGEYEIKSIKYQKINKWLYWDENGNPTKIYLIKNKLINEILNED